MSKAQNMDRSSLLPFTANGEVIEERGGGLCDCFSDWNSCIWGYCCPCYLFGRTAQRAGVTGHTLTGCLAYVFLGSVIPSMIGIFLLLHFSTDLGGYDDCVREHPGAIPSGGSSSMSMEDRSQTFADRQDCDTLLFHALVMLYRNLFLFDLLIFTAFGVFCGYYRQLIYAALGGAGRSGKSFLLHCCPCTHFCALCQEARAVDVANQAAPYTGL